MIYTAPCVRFWIWADRLRGEVGGRGWRWKSRVLWARNCKCYGVHKSIPTNRFLQAGNRFLGSIKRFTTLGSEYGDDQTPTDTIGFTPEIQATCLKDNLQL
jgi:hypothetical protein